MMSFLNGKKFEDLTEKLAIYQSQLEDYQVYSHVILPPTPDKNNLSVHNRKQTIKNIFLTWD